MTAPTAARLTILLIGTADTKADELLYLKEQVTKAGLSALIMDTGILREPPFVPDINHYQVALASEMSLPLIRALDDENIAVQRMAVGAARLAKELHAAGVVHGALAIGGTAGTDLALDVMAALPLGVPKLIVSTIAFSHFIPPDRLAPDLTMMLWSGGLWGLNTACCSVLRQAAGAIVGAAVRNTGKVQWDRPAIGVSSLGSSCCRYLTYLKPWLEEQGYEVIVFHATGMGGRALECLLHQRRLVAVLDLCLAEISNAEMGGLASATQTRLDTCGQLGIPQIVAPAGIDFFDVPSWQPVPGVHQTRLRHAHNRLLTSLALTEEEKNGVARVVAQKLNAARDACAFVMPLRGLNEWDRAMQVWDPAQACESFHQTLRRELHPKVALHAIPAHVNDLAFSQAVMEIFQQWVHEGIVARPAFEDRVGAEVA